MRLSHIHSYYYSQRGRGYSEEYQAVLTYAEANTITQPSSPIRSLQNTFVRDVSSIWAKLDVVRLFATNELTTGAFSLINLKNPSANLATLHGTTPPVYSYMGFKGDGVDAYINNNWNPTTAGGNYSLNSAYEAVYVSKKFSSNNNLTGCASNTGSQMHNASTTTHRINSGGDVTGAVDLSGIGFKALNRSSSTGIDVYAETTGTAKTIASFQLPNENKLIFRQGTGYGDAEISAYFAGGALTAAENTILRNALNDYLTGIYLLNYTDSTPINLYIIAGQSNAAGRGFDTEIAAELNGLVGAQILKLLPTPPGSIDGTSNFQELQLGVNNTTELLGTNHGTEMRFGYEMNLLNSNTYIIKLGAGNTSMSSHWNATAGSLFSALTNAALLDVGLYKLRNTVRRPIVFRGFIFLQGESDCSGGLGAAYQASYLAMVKGFLDKMNNGAYKTDKLRWFDWLVKNDGLAGYTTTDFDNVIAGKQYVMNNFLTDNPTYSAKIKALTYSDPAAIPFNSGDHQHYSAAGLDTMAQTTVSYFSQYINE